MDHRDQYCCVCGGWRPIWKSGGPLWPSKDTVDRHSGVQRFHGTDGDVAKRGAIPAVAHARGPIFRRRMGRRRHARRGICPPRETRARTRDRPKLLRGRMGGLDAGVPHDLFTFPPEVAWRYLFLVGIVPALFAFVIRRTTKDATELTGESTHTAEAPPKPKVSRLFQSDLWKRTLTATLLGIGVQGIYYSVFLFLPTYLQTERGLSIVGTATYTWVAILGSFIGYLSSGVLLDAIGRRPTFLFFFLGSAGSVSLFILMPAAKPEFGIAIIFLLGFFSSGQAGGTGAYLAELFPTDIRATGQAFAYNFGRGLAAFGPLTVGLAAESIGWGSAIMTITIAGAVTGIIALALLPETKNSQLVDSIS